MIQGKSGGSAGVHTGRLSGYWNTGKGSTWEGGVHEAAFAYWPGTIKAGTRSSEVVSSLDLFPTASALAGAPLPTDRVYDGKDMTPVLMGTGNSAHTTLFFYGGACGSKTPSAARHGRYKAHWCTGPGLGGCSDCPKLTFTTSQGAAVPLLFDIYQDPSEAYPLNLDGWKNSDAGINTRTTTHACDEIDDPEVSAACAAIVQAYDEEVKTFRTGTLVPPPLLPSEKDGVAVCCDRARKCDCNGKPSLRDDAERASK